MELHSLTAPELIFPHLEGSGRNDLLRSLARRIKELGYVADSNKLYERLLEREDLGSTGIGDGIAIPHCKMNGLERVVLAIAILDEGIDFGAVDQQPVRLFFVIISPARKPALHLQSLAAISSWVKADGHAETLFSSDDPEILYKRLKGE